MDRYCHLPQLQIHVFSLFSHLFHLEQILSHLPPEDNHSSTNKKRTNKQMNEEMIARVKTRKRKHTPASHLAQLLQLLLAPPSQVLGEVETLPVKELE